MAGLARCVARSAVILARLIVSALLVGSVAVSAIAQTSQTITFGALASKTFGAAPFTVSATGSSGLAVTFSSLTISVCTANGTTVTLVAAGPCTIQASQAGNGNYNAAPNISQNFTVGVANQTITFVAPGNQPISASPVTLTATASSGLAVSLSSLTPGVCTVSGSAATLLTGGTCTIQAAQAGNGNYNAAPNVNQSFAVIAVPQFSGLLTYSVGNYPENIAVGDFNGDSIPDLAVANAYSGNVSILIGTGDGTFTPGTPVQTGGLPIAVVVGDFNGDGKLDLAVADFYWNVVGIFAGSGNGTFTRVGTINAGTAPISIAVGDLNGDGKLDLAVANGTYGSTTGQTVTVALGNGDGSFRSPVSYPTGPSPYGVVIADFNGDGKPDLAVANGDSNTVSVLLGYGDGTFAPAVNYATHYYPDGLAVGDFNGDGKFDLAVVNDFSNDVSIFLGRGDGTFNPATNIPAGSGPASVAVADFNGDGFADLVIANRFDNTLVLLLGNGNGTFQAPLIYSVGVQLEAIVAKDLNDDGSPDLVVTNAATNAVAVLLNSSSASTATSLTVQSGSPQSATVSIAYATPLAVLIQDAGGNPLAGRSISFTAPVTGASGTFSGAGNVAQAVSNVSGVATAPSFTANTTAGSFTVTATAAALRTTFALTNIAGATQVPAFTSAPPPNGTINVAYSYAVTANGTPTPTFSVPANALPTGLALNGPSGLITGTPNAGGSFAGMLTAANGLLPNATQTFAITIAGMPQTITFGPIADQPLGAPPLTVSAMASSGLAVIFSSRTAAVCTINGSAVTLTAPGTCTVRASQPGNAGYAPAPDVDRSFSITAASIVLVTPANGSTHTAPANIRFTAAAAFSVGTVSKVEYFNGAALLGSATSAPYAFTWTSVGAGSYVVTAKVTNSGGMKFASMPANIVVNTGQGATFARSFDTFAGGGYPSGLGLGDLNGDGKLDVAWPYLGNFCNITLLVDGKGSLLQQRTSCGGAAQGGRVLIADFNRDSKPDLANAGGNIATVMLANGDGSFKAASSNAVGNRAEGIAAADFNGDSKLDLAISNVDDSTVSILLGNGDGTFRPAVTLAVGPEPSALAVGDFNGDGKVDLAITGTYNSTVSIILGNGDGTFQPARTFATGPGPIAIVLADFNDDGKLDLVTANFAGDNVSVLLGNGDGTFQPSRDFPAGGEPWDVAIADLNGDSKPDLVVANRSDNTISVLLGNGNGTFQAPTSFVVGSYPSYVAVGDLDGDGRPDIVVANEADLTLSVLLNTSGRAIQAPVFTSAPLPSGNATNAYNYAVTASGAPTPSFAVTSGALPPGLTLQRNGLVTGTLPLPGSTYTGTITASNGIAPDATQAFSITPAWLTQTIVFDPIALVLMPPPVNATASSGFPVTISSLTPASCRLSGSTSGSQIIFQVIAGTCSIRASQVGGGAYLPAPNVDQTFTFDLNPPLIRISSPPTNTNYGAPATITLTASLPSNLYVGLVNHIDFYAGSNLIGTVSARPYTVTWSNVGVGTYTLTAKVTTNFQGGTAVSSPITVTVSSTPPPTVNLTAPPNNTTYPAPANITLTASATSNVAGGSISKVEFYSGSTRLSTVTTTPYSFTWANVAPGPYTLTAKATDNLGVTATSTPVTVIVTAILAAPTVTLTTPKAGTEYAIGQGILLTAQASAPGRTIDHVEFYADGSLLGSVPVTGGFASATISLTWTGAALGTHALSAKVVATDGTNGASAPVTVTVSDLAVSLLEPFQGQVYQTPAFIRITANPSETIGTIEQVDFYCDGVIIGTSTIAPYTLVWRNVGAGAHTVKAVVRDASGLASSSGTVAISVISAATLQIAAGLDGSTAADDNVSVAGTVRAPMNSAVTVNGRIAGLHVSGSFFIDNIELQPGSNTVTVILNSQDAGPVTQTITLNSVGAAPFKVIANPTEGFAPFTTRLTITNRGAVAFQRIEVDTNGDGLPDANLASLVNNTAVVDISYSDPGVHSIGVKVFDASNNVIYTAVRKVLVHDPRDVALELADLYLGMLDRLSFGDLTGALNVVSASMRSKYSTVFTTLQGQMSTIVDQLRSIQDATVSDEIAEFHVTRTTGIGPQTFSILFMRGEDGVWRIEGM